MKYLIVVFVTCLLGAFAIEEMPEEVKAQIKQYQTECLAETGVDPALFEDIKAGKDYEVTDQINCLATCVLKKTATMRPDETLDETVTHKYMAYHLPEDKVVEVYDTCKDLVGKDTCETGGKIVRCLRKYNAV